MTSAALAPQFNDRGDAAIKARVPIRLQRSRKKGARTPEGARYVGRPTLYGNPFRSDRFGHARSVVLHRDWLAGRISALRLERLGFCPGEIATLERRRDRILDRVHELAGLDLQCWCPASSRWCHADTLLAMANR
jgi:hypothetical protein